MLQRTLCWCGLSDCTWGSWALRSTWCTPPSCWARSLMMASPSVTARSWESSEWTHAATDTQHHMAHMSFLDICSANLPVHQRGSVMNHVVTLSSKLLFVSPPAAMFSWRQLLDWNSCVHPSATPASSSSLCSSHSSFSTLTVHTPPRASCWISSSCLLSSTRWENRVWWYLDTMCVWWAVHGNTLPFD